MPNRIKSILLVSFQFLFIFLLLWTSPKSNISTSAFILFILSLLLMLWALITMQKSKLRIWPQPAVNDTLVVSGPYRFIRHPMYTAILLVSIGLLLHHFTILRLTLAVALIIVLLIKLGWEEKMLAKKFFEYGRYMQRTWRIIPFIY